MRTNLANKISDRDFAAGLVFTIGSLACSLVCFSYAFADEKPETGAQLQERVETIKLERSGGGLRVGMWDVQDLERVEGAEYSRIPSFECFFQKGIDAHLSLESSLGLWKRSQRIEESGSFGSSASTEEIQSYVVPAFSAIKFFPFTGPRSALEPYADAGIGVALGIDDREVTSAGLLDAGTDSGTSFLTGFGFKTGTGLEWMFTKMLGVDVSGRYQWLRFSKELGGVRTFKGFGIDAGLTYGFQY